MTIRPKKVTLIIPLLFVYGCSKYPENPEEVVEKFATYLSTGKCEDAMDLCTGNAIETVQGSIDAGCEPYDTKIDSVTCEINGNKATCLCYETRDPYGNFSFPYELVKEDNKWKIRTNTKDTDLPRDWE